MYQRVSHIQILTKDVRSKLMISNHEFHQLHKMFTTAYRYPLCLFSPLQLTQLKVNKYVYFEYMAATNYTGPITHHSNDDITLDLWAKRLEQGFMSVRNIRIVIAMLQCL